MIAGSWAGDPGRSPLVGIAVVADAAAGRVAWLPAEVALAPAVAGALAAHGSVVMHDAKPLMRSMLSRGTDMKGLVLDTQIAKLKAAQTAAPAPQQAAIGRELEGISKAREELESDQLSKEQRKVLSNGAWQTRNSKR